MSINFKVIVCVLSLLFFSLKMLHAQNDMAFSILVPFVI